MKLYTLFQETIMHGTYDFWIKENEMKAYEKQTCHLAVIYS